MGNSKAIKEVLFREALNINNVRNNVYKIGNYSIFKKDNEIYIYYFGYNVLKAYIVSYAKSKELIFRFNGYGYSKSTSCAIAKMYRKIYNNMYSIWTKLLTIDRVNIQIWDSNNDILLYAHYRNGHYVYNIKFKQLKTNKNY